jgi:hypothetical protein
VSSGPTLLQKVLSIIFLVLALAAFIWQVRIMWRQDIKKIICTEDKEETEKNSEIHIDVKA